MIQLKVSGRAGNQLFQYATVYAYCKKNNIKENIILSFDYVGKQKKKATDSVEFCDYIKQFGIKDYEVKTKIKYNKFQKILDLTYKILFKIIRIKCKIVNKKISKNDWIVLDKLLHKTMNKNGLFYYFPTNIKFYKSKTSNIIFFGSFEDSRFFDSYYIEIRDKILNNSYTKDEMYQQLKNKNTICITIRRGDFLAKEHIKKHYICDNTYFEKAIINIQKGVKDAIYVVFSDDIDWCKKNMNFPKGTIYESGKNTIPEKIFMMSNCKNFIISNSTFSWWAQYLALNSKKIVIAPSEWNKFEYMDNIYQKNWIKIEV